MPKRKLSEIEDGNSDDVGEDDIKLIQRRNLVAQKLEQGYVALHRALKLAAAFERQKFGRRRKTAAEKKDDSTSGRLDAEYAALKNLNLALVAKHHLNKTLLKIKSIASSPLLPASVSQSRAPSNDTPTLNVAARLYKANPTQKTLEETLTNIKALLGVENSSGKGEVRQTRKESKSLTVQPGPKNLDQQESDTESWAGFSDSKEDEGGEELSDGEDEDEAMYDYFKGRLAGSSDEDSSEEDNESKYEKRAGTNYLDSLSPSESESESKPSAGTGPIHTKSSFLPSLSANGFWSGSESEPEDEAPKLERKNRRGQRARRQLWEKKYGSNAKHVQTEQQQNNRDRGWDMKRGAVEEKGRKGGFGGRRNQKSQPGSRGPQISGSNTTELRQRPPKDDGPLHPSWEAAKQAKEKKQTASFQGKKITFD